MTKTEIQANFFCLYSFLVWILFFSIWISYIMQFVYVYEVANAIRYFLSTCVFWKLPRKHHLSITRSSRLRFYVTPVEIQILTISTIIISKEFQIKYMSLSNLDGQSLIPPFNNNNNLTQPTSESRIFELNCISICIRNAFHM